MLAQDPRVRLGRPDAIHQLRVACRRLRSDLATFTPLLDPGAADRLRQELAWLADRLGAARDVEVLRERLAATFVADPLTTLDRAAYDRLDALLGAREQAALALATMTLEESRYLRLLCDAVAFVVAPPVTADAAAPVKAVLPGLVAAIIADADGAVARMSKKGPDARWHRARIRAKRARYAAEAAAVALGAPAAATGAAMAAVQDVLGKHQDAAVAADAVVAIAQAHPGDAELVLLCGRLAERERAAVRSARAAFGSVWADAERVALRRWLS